MLEEELARNQLVFSRTLISLLSVGNINNLLSKYDISPSSKALKSTPLLPINDSGEGQVQQVVDQEQQQPLGHNSVSIIVKMVRSPGL
jgi:hypothetical protein